MKPTIQTKNRKGKVSKSVDLSDDIVQEPIVVYGAASLDGRVMGLLNVKYPSPTLRFDTDLIQLIRAGISKQSLDHLIAQIGYSLTDIASLLHVSDRNIRRYTPSDKLNTEQSERLVELAKLYARGEEVFGSIEGFNEWMDAKILTLGNQTPKSFLDTSMGIQLIHKELVRIEHGVFA